MKKKTGKSIFVFLTALFLLTLCACSRNTASESTGESGPSIRVVDMTGRKITLDKPADRVVALSAADCEILYAIGAGDKLVGRGEYCDFPTEVLDLPSVQSGNDTNIEQIIALRPHVLLMSSMAQTDDQIAQLEAAGIHVVVSDAQDIEGVYKAIDIIGTVMDKQDNAKQVIEDMQQGFAELKKKAAASDKKGKTVYFEVSPLEYGLWAAGSHTFMNEVAEMVGLKNCFDDMKGWAQISEEQVLQRNPDYIVTIAMYHGKGPDPVEAIRSRKGWGKITAVVNDDILNLHNNELSRPTPRLLKGAEILYDFVYEK